MIIGNLFTPYTYGFFRNGLAVAVLAGAICGLVGTYVVLRNMSAIGHGLSHAIFGGAAASAVMNVNYYVGAGVWGLASGMAITAVSRRARVGSDAAIGIVTTASFAVGLIFSSMFGRAKKSIEAVLFGSILGVQPIDVLGVLIVGILVVAAILYLYRPLLFATFDADVAGSFGVPVARVDAVMMLLLSVTILVSMRVIGVLLISALIVTPTVTARLLTNKFSGILILGPAIGALTAFIGMNAAYHLDVPPGAAVILTASLVFLAVFLVGGSRGRRRIAQVHTH
jgi:ABC-type Mn2+/Zn2+ transport system permease subunit